MTPREAADFKAHPISGPLHARLLQRAHFDIVPYIVRVTEGPWSSNPAGFKFRCADRAGLYGKLVTRPNFGFDRVKRAEIREISEDGSLHVWVDAKTNEGTVHLDSISIAESKDCENIVVYRPTMVVLRHIQRDYLHVDEGVPTPLDGPSRSW